ncbi:AHH domain-containing protein [Brucella tritici]|uniref:AHH domain-containing protein n=1 Tax=Brucella tritici TaxID=94626 RepID=UPI00158FF5B1|nr:AHH domain-containing protein [Brucella tritici]
MAETPTFQEHHIIERQAFRGITLLQQLSKQGQFNIDDMRNLLNMPADPELAAKMGVSPHNGGPLKAYSDALAERLIALEETKDFQAMQIGDKAAAQRLADRINAIRDTMRAGLINGDLFTNTPKDMSPEATKAKVADFMGELDGYSTEIWWS